MDDFFPESQETDERRAIGLLLRLKKRHPGHADSEMSDEEYNLFGYYDRLSIQVINEWNELDPSRSVIPFEFNNEKYSTDSLADTDDASKTIEENIQSESYFDEYPLKLLCPQVDNADENFDYSILESPSFTPFISIAMLHFTEETIAHIRDDANPDIALTKFMYKVMVDVAKSLWHDESVVRFKELRCGLYFSLGFSDIVLVFQTKNMHDVSDFIFALRSEKLSHYQNRKNKKTYIISTAYVIAGINGKYNVINNTESIDSRNPAAIKEEDTRDLRLSIRFILKPGVEPSGFYKELHTKFINKYGENNVSSWFPAYSQLSAAGNTNVYSQMFGQSDLMFLFDTNPCYLLAEYLNEGFFNPKSEFYRKYILNMRSSLRKVGGREFPCQIQMERAECEPLKCSDINQDTPLEENLNMQRVKEMVRSCKIELYKYFSGRNKLMSKISLSKTPPKDSMRLYNGISSILGLYMDLTSRSHAFDLGSLFDNVIKTFTYSLREGKMYLDRSSARFKNLNPKDVSNPDYQAWCYGILDFIARTDENIDMFRSFFNELILDFSRSDRLFIEGRTMLHVGVGSATKLIVAYARIINELTEAAKDTREHYNAKDSDDLHNCTYAFLMACGGTSVTEAIKFFSNIPPRFDMDWPELYHLAKPNATGQRISEHVLIRLKLPESTLFMPDLIMFFIMHEAFHYVGYRNPTLRVDKVAESICRYIAYYILDAMASDSYGCYLHLKDMKDTNESEYIDAINDIRDNIYKNIHKRYVEMPPISEIYCHSQYLQHELINIFAEICLENFGENSFSEEVNEFCRQGFLNFWNKILDRYIGDEQDSDIARTIMHVIDYYEQSTDGALIDTNNLLLFDSLPNYYMIDDYLDEFDRRLIKRSETREGLESLIKRNHTASLQYIATAYINAYKEAFADGTACLYAGCESAVDYLYVFYRSNENPQEAFTSIPENVLRFGSVLVVIDKEAADLMDCDLDEFDTRLPALLQKYSEGLNKYNPDDEAAISVYIHSFGTLLREYRYFYRRYRIAQPLEEYIRSCRNDHSALANDPNNSVVSDIRRLFMWKKDNNSYAGVWRVLIKYWARTACSVDKDDSLTIHLREGVGHESI